MQSPSWILGGGYPLPGRVPGDGNAVREEQGRLDSAKKVVFSMAPTAPTPALESTRGAGRVPPPQMPPAPLAPLLGLGAGDAVSAPKFQEVNPAALDSNIKVAAQLVAVAGGLTAVSERLRSEGAADAGRAVLQGMSADEGGAMLLANDAMELEGLAEGLRIEEPERLGNEKALAAGSVTAPWSSDYKKTIAEAEKQIAILDRLLASNPNPTALNSESYQVAETLQKTFGQTVTG